MFGSAMGVGVWVVVLVSSVVLVGDAGVVVGACGWCVGDVRPVFGYLWVPFKCNLAHSVLKHSCFFSESRQI